LIELHTGDLLAILQNPEDPPDREPTQYTFFSPAGLDALPAEMLAFFSEDNLKKDPFAQTVLNTFLDGHLLSQGLDIDLEADSEVINSCPSIDISMYLYIYVVFQGKDLHIYVHNVSRKRDTPSPTTTGERNKHALHATP
jgi:hypothetical protein